MRPVAHQADEIIVTTSLEKLTAALMPCGKETYPQYSIIGERDFQAYKKPCISNDCEKKVFCPGEACGFDRVFGKQWRRWWL